MIAVIDYCKGNLKSVERGLIGAGADARITDDPRVIAQAEALVLPGVGAFADASAFMQESGQMDVIYDAVVNRGVPFLGICLGEQLMFAAGEEGAQPGTTVRGLGFLEGVSTKLSTTDTAGNTYKIPHVGWNSIEFDADATDDEKSPLLCDIKLGEYFYFTHSYCAPDTSAALAYTTHSCTFPSVVQYGDHAYGVQFHPEKSSDAGAQLLKNFVRLAKRV